MNGKSNEGQIKFWNEGPGSKWVKHQVGLDACFAKVSEHLLSKCSFQSNMEVVDIGCGAGATCFDLVGVNEEEINVTGVDVSKPLIEHAKGRLEKSGLTGISFKLMDVQNDQFPRQQYDLMVSRFGCMFFTNPVKAFKNIAQSIKPNGAMHFACWSTLDSNPWFSIPKSVAEARLGEGAPSAPREPGPMVFADHDYLGTILTEAGLSQFSLSNEKVIISTSYTIEEMALLASSLGPAVRLLNEKGGSEDDRKAIEEGVVDGFEQYKTSNGIEVPATIVFVSVLI